MYTIDEVSDMLDDIVDEIPSELFKHLNGGIALLEECKPHPASRGNLFIMGQYRHRSDMGRSIVIYYGSFMQIYGHLSEERLREKLKSTLLHEFTHHWESLAGEKGLEIEDQIRIHRYKEQQKKINES
ncbi:MAG: metallopeptidase family protein [Lachnospiraceae bacterium]|nr:metallopeptidase family protein [Lachnospiraceae bacterium]